MMRKTLWIIVLLLICSFTVMAEEQEQQRDCVFMGFCWGDSVDALGRVEEATSEEAQRLIEDFYPIHLSEKDFPNLSFKLYKRQQEIMSLGTIPVQEVIYGFINDKLAMIQVNSYDWLRLQELIKARYGEFEEFNQRTALLNHHGKLSDTYGHSYLLNQYTYENYKTIGDTYIGSGTLPRGKGYRGFFHLHSISLFAEAKVAIEKRQKEISEAHKKRLQAESQLW